jgi:methyl-accepting chemotaxis protein
MVLTEDINDNVNTTKAHIHDVDSSIEATKVLVEDIVDNVKEIEGVARGVDNSMQRFSICLHAHTHLFSIVSQHSHARA